MRNDWAICFIDEMIHILLSKECIDKENHSLHRLDFIKLTKFEGNPISSNINYYVQLISSKTLIGKLKLI